MNFSLVDENQFSIRQKQPQYSESLCYLAMCKCKLVGLGLQCAAAYCNSVTHIVDLTELLLKRKYIQKHDDVMEIPIVNLGL